MKMSKKKKYLNIWKFTEYIVYRYSSVLKANDNAKIAFGGTIIKVKKN